MMPESMRVLIILSLYIGHKFNIMNKKRANCTKLQLAPFFYRFSTILAKIYSSFTTVGLRNLMCNSRNCASLTADGA